MKKRFSLTRWTTPSATSCFENLEAVLEGRTLDYVIVNHMEPDHASTLSEVVRRYPEVKIVCNAKTVAIIKQFFDFDIDSRAVIVKENDTFCTGKHTYTFVMAPLWFTGRRLWLPTI